MTTAWKPPKHLPVFFEIPDTPPAQRITIRTGMSPLGLTLSVIRSAGWYAAGGCLLIVLFNAASALVPLALGAAIDEGIGPVTRGTPTEDALGGFLLWVAAIAGLYLVINVTYHFGGWIGWYCVQRAQYELSARIVERILDARGTAGPAQLPGRLLSVATSDSDRVGFSLYFAIYPLGNVAAVLVAAVSLFVIHPVLGLTVIVGAPLLLVFMAIVARPLRNRAEQEQEGIADAASSAADLITGYRVISGIHAQQAAANHYRRVSRTALRGTLAANTAEGAVRGTNAALMGLFAGVVTAVAAALTFDGSISVGELIAAAAMAQVLLEPLRELIEVAATIGAQALASARRVLDQLHVEPNPEARGDTPVPDPPLLQITTQDIESLDVEPGEFVAIELAAVDADALVAALTLAGSVGAQVKMNGQPLPSYDPSAIRRLILVAPHQADLLEDTVLASVMSGSTDRDRAVAALRTARCESLEHELPLGYETPISDLGRTLSGGQRQRVALARAICREPRILVLHDPTNSVDSATESDIAERVHTARAGMTTLVITSSAAFHAVADRSVRRPPGQLVASVPPKSLDS
ncbi:ABC transporter ATP-binding protein [Rhodococcus sovatensis]|uniref:ABC transporter ATP-binding protein n=1 Tax=Rhodococcus sovatensis TaxID=1805840 RepID=A0ABZ2PIQ6_9NOCA